MKPQKENNMPSFNVQNAKALTITEGVVKTIHDSNGQLLWGAIGYSTKYEGDTSQASEPTPNNPQSISVVTGTQTVTLSDGTNTEDFTVSLGSEELCKSSTYLDYIWKDGSDWKLHKAFEKVVLNGQENWSRDTTSGGDTRYFRLDIADLIMLDANVQFIGYSDYYPPVTGNAAYLRQVDYGVACTAAANRLRIRNKDIEATADFQTWLSTHNTTVYYALETPTDTTITDTTLIGQLNAIEAWLTRYGYTATVSGTLPLIINQTALS